MSTVDEQTLHQWLATNMRHADGRAMVGQWLARDCLMQAHVFSCKVLLTLANTAQTILLLCQHTKASTLLSTSPRESLMPCLCPSLQPFPLPGHCRKGQNIQCHELKNLNETACNSQYHSESDNGRCETLLNQVQAALDGVCEALSLWQLKNCKAKICKNLNH